MLLLSVVTITVTHDFTETDHFYQLNMHDLICFSKYLDFISKKNQKVFGN